MASRHVSRCLLAGLVAALPVGGTILIVALAEGFLRPLLPNAIYVPGAGLLTVVLLLYLLGLAMTSFLGRWLWTRVDSFLSRLPALGGIYRTIKQVLGYGEGSGALFQRVVLVPDAATGARELGLVTGSVAEGGETQLVVFVPGSPNPSQGRLLLLPENRAVGTDWKVDRALKTLFSLGKAPAPGP